MPPVLRHLLLVLAIVMIGTPCGAAVPSTMSYQGTLTNSSGAPVSDGTYDLTFRLYADSAATSSIWSEENTLAVTGGAFGVLLGNKSPLGSLSFDSQYWLGIQLGSDPEFVPRVKLAASPYALGLSQLPGLSHSKSTVGEITSSSWQQVASTAITTPTSGYVMVTLHAAVAFWPEAGRADGMDFDIYNNGATSTYEGVGYASTTGTPALRDERSVTVVRVFAKPAGTHTFAFMLRRTGNTAYGRAFLDNGSITALFVPTAYGTVAP
jgi:hypothetical protein